MRRREFIALLAGTAGFAGGASAQQPPTMPVIGFLSSRSPDESAHLVAAFRKGLGELGYTEGRNVRVEYRWAEGRYERLQALAEELVHVPVAVIATAGGTPSALAAKAATTVTPVVFLSGGDVVRLGLVSSLHRPEGNLTGVAQFTTELMAKRLELVRQLVPGVLSVAAISNPRNRNTDAEIEEVQQAARALGLTLEIVYASTDVEIDAAFPVVAQLGSNALVVHTDPFFDTRRERFAELASRSRIPAIYGQKEYALVGGLISYGTSFAATYQQAGNYTARILNGAKPADLPVVQPTKFELVINLKAANALGLTIAPTLLARADEVIE